MKNKFIKELEHYLTEKRVSTNQVDEIVLDYEELYSEYESRGFSDEDIRSKLGSPRSIYLNLKATLHKKEESWKSKIVSISPFVAVIIYILIGYFAKVWHPTWLIFLIIPLSSVLLYGKNFSNRLLASSPFIATAIFLTIGFYLKIWHPTWLVFLIIPILGIINTKDEKYLVKVIRSLVFLGLIIAILLPYFDLMSPTYSWLFILAFMIPSPILSLIKKKSNKKVFKDVITSVSILIAIVIYIIIVRQTGQVKLALLAFLLPFIAGIWSGKIIFEFNIGKGKQFIIFSIVTTLTIAAFIVLGVIYNNWAYVWQLLLLIPVAAIVILPDNQDSKLIAIMPFISIVIFYSIGYFYNAWAISWLAFLLIPITSILQGEKVVKVYKNEDENK